MMDASRSENVSISSSERILSDVLAFTTQSRCRGYHKRAARCSSCGALRSNMMRSIECEAFWSLDKCQGRGSGDCLSARSLHLGKGPTNSRRRRASLTACPSGSLLKYTYISRPSLASAPIRFAQNASSSPVNPTPCAPLWKRM